VSAQSDHINELPLKWGSPLRRGGFL